MHKDTAPEAFDTYSDEAATFGDRITFARVESGMNRSQLARRLGIKAQTLQNWEEDRSEPRANKLQMLAGVLNVSIFWLMSGDGDGPVQEVDSERAVRQDELLAEFRELTQAQSELSKRMGRLEKKLRRLLV